MEIKFLDKFNQFENELCEVVRAFGIEVKVLKLEDLDTNENDILIFDMQESTEYFSLSIEFNDYKVALDFKKIEDKLKEKSLYKREAKVLIYDCIVAITDIKLPYGALMGIRPTKMFREIMLSGQNAREYFLNDMRASSVKVDLIESVVKNQLPVYSYDTKDIDLFINIPICTSRCSYCTFISHELKRVVRQVPQYIAQLRREIEQALLIVKNYNLRAIYVGGGTPTSIDVESLNYILSPLKDLNTLEFTVEAGRPDTITYEKLKVLKANNVNRISINPQSFNQNTLDLIGRTHSIEDFYTAYNMAKELAFDINMDLIAMLPNESFEDFKYSVDKTLQLEPQNITVHTLSLKRGSKLTEENYQISEDDLAKKMVDYSIDKISKKYNPYYMYRLKNISGGLENIGYALKGKESIYNVDIMEESVSIIACGAGGISKRLYEQNRLERCANPKGIDIYLQRENEILQKKQGFFNK